jgi:DNA-binding transcriptional MocR family regulator
VNVLPSAADLFAARAAGITGSPIDASTSLLQRQQHDVVRLAMGSPAAECVPTEIFTGILAAESARPDAFDYGPTEGDQRLRSALAGLLAARGQPVPPEELLITTGGMQGLDLVCKLFVGDGDLVAVESPTYTNGTATIAGYRGRVMEVPVDSDGMDVEALAELAAAQPRPPKLIYTIPTFQNPSGTTLSLARRTRLLALAAQWGAIVLEDDPYEMLRFAGHLPPHLAALAGEYRGRKQAMRQALGDELAGLGARWTDPDGGYFSCRTPPRPTPRARPPGRGRSTRSPTGAGRTAWSGRRSAAKLGCRTLNRSPPWPPEGRGHRSPR